MHKYYPSHRRERLRHLGPQRAVRAKRDKDVGVSEAHRALIDGYKRGAAPRRIVGLVHACLLPYIIRDLCDAYPRSHQTT